MLSIISELRVYIYTFWQTENKMNGHTPNAKFCVSHKKGNGLIHHEKFNL